MSNFFILDQGPVASPGHCGICGYSGLDRKYLDPRKDFEFYGTFIICELCVMAMAQDFGYMEPTRVAALEKRNLEVESELEQLTDLRDTLEIVHGALNRFSPERRVHDSGDLVSDDSAPEQYDETTNDNYAPELPFSEGSGDSEVDDDHSERRPDDLLLLSQLSESSAALDI